MEVSQAGFKQPAAATADLCVSILRSFVRFYLGWHPIIKIKKSLSITKEFSSSYNYLISDPLPFSVAVGRRQAAPGS